MHVIIYSKDAEADRFFRDVLKYEAFIAEMESKKVKCAPIEEQRWGSITRLTLPGGGTLGVYQPKHASPLKPRAI